MSCDALRHRFVAVSHFGTSGLLTIWHREQINEAYEALRDTVPLSTQLGPSRASHEEQLRMPLTDKIRDEYRVISQVTGFWNTPTFGTPIPIYNELVRWRNREETTKRTTPTEGCCRPERPTPRLLVLRSEGHKCN